MSEERRLDHPGTVRPAHRCPFPDVHNRLEDAHYLWHEAQCNYFSPPRFRTHLNALIQSLRTVTWLIQKNKAVIPEFDNWYSEWKERMKSDPVLRWLVEARNRIEHQGDLERHSVLRVSVVASHAGEKHLDFVESPSRKTSDIIKRLNFSRIPQELMKEGFLKLERRWVAANLPGYEILDALAYTYGVLADLVDDAHAQVGLPVPSLVVMQPDGSYEPFRGSEAYLQGRLPCMVASQSDRELWIPLKSGGRLELVTEARELTARKMRRAKRRYGTAVLAPEGKTPESLEEWARYYWGIARHMFERDGHHVHIAFLFHDGELLQNRGMKAASHGELFPIYRHLAEKVAHIGATEVIVINEVWTAPYDPAHPYRRAELSPERGEGLLLCGVAADGKQIRFFAPITRKRRKAQLGETDESQRDIHPSLAPVLAVWRHPRPGDDT